MPWHSTIYCKQNVVRIAGMMSSITIIQTPFIMVMMKVDLLSKEARKKLYRYIDPDSLDEMMDEVEENSANKGRIHLFKKWISVVSVTVHQSSLSSNKSSSASITLKAPSYDAEG